MPPDIVYTPAWIVEHSEDLVLLQGNEWLFEEESEARGKMLNNAELYHRTFGLLPAGTIKLTFDDDGNADLECKTGAIGRKDAQGKLDVLIIGGDSMKLIMGGVT